MWLRLQTTYGMLCTVHGSKLTIYMEVMKALVQQLHSYALPLEAKYSPQWLSFPLPSFTQVMTLTPTSCVIFRNMLVALLLKESLSI